MAVAKTTMKTAHHVKDLHLAPKGHGRWSLRLLADKLVELEIVDDISHETVRQTLKKTNSSLG